MKLDPGELVELDELLKTQGQIELIDDPWYKGGPYLKIGEARHYIRPVFESTYKALVPLINDPLLYDTEVYVHPVGFRSFLWHLIRLVRINRHTPYVIRLYSDTIHGEIFDRWLKVKLQTCGE